MASEFEPNVRTEETPEARIVIVDLQGFGFRREDLRVRINNRGNLVMSGERRGKEIEEMTKVRGRLQKIHRHGHRFRKVIDVDENLNFDGITAKFKGEALRVYLPLVQIFDQQNQIPSTHELHRSGEVQHVADQSVKSNDERFNLEEQDDSIPEKAVNRQDNDKGKASTSAKELLELLEEEKQELLEGLAGEPPVSTQTSALSAPEPGSAHQSDAIQSKSKQEKADEKEGQTSSTQENIIESSVGDGKPDEKKHAEEGNEDGTGIVYGIDRHSQENGS